jgi:hypothetical protein
MLAMPGLGVATTRCFTAFEYELANRGHILWNMAVTCRSPVRFANVDSGATPFVSSTIPISVVPSKKST